MFAPELETGLEIVARSLGIYITVLALLRVGGRREMAQATTTDIVVMILIANGVQNAMVGADSSWVGGLLSAATLVSANYLVARLRWRFPRIQRLVDGAPTTIAENGRWIDKALHSLQLTQDDALALTGSEVDTVEDLAWATVEPTGHIRYKTRRGTVHRSTTKVAT